jgi:hypothetical protein
MIITGLALSSNYVLLTSASDDVCEMLKVRLWSLLSAYK